MVVAAASLTDSAESIQGRAAIRKGLFKTPFTRNITDFSGNAWGEKKKHQSLYSTPRRNQTLSWAGLGSNLGSTTINLGQVTETPWVSVFSSIKRRKVQLPLEGSVQINNEILYVKSLAQHLPSSVGTGTMA